MKEAPVVLYLERCDVDGDVSRVLLYKGMQVISRAYMPSTDLASRIMSMAVNGLCLNMKLESSMLAVTTPELDSIGYLFVGEDGQRILIQYELDLINAIGHDDDEEEDEHEY